MLHRLCDPPSIPLSFNLAAVVPRWNAYALAKIISSYMTKLVKLFKAMPSKLKNIFTLMGQGVDYQGI